MMFGATQWDVITLSPRERRRSARVNGRGSAAMRVSKTYLFQRPVIRIAMELRPSDFATPDFATMWTGWTGRLSAQKY